MHDQHSHTDHKKGAFFGSIYLMKQVKVASSSDFRLPTSGFRFPTSDFSVFFLGFWKDEKESDGLMIDKQR